MQVVLFTFVLVFLAALGFVAWKLGGKLWHRLHLLVAAGDAVYGVAPISKWGLFGLIALLVVSLVCLLFGDLLTSWLCIIGAAAIVHGIIVRTSPQLAFQVLGFSALLAILLVCTLVGVVVMFFFAVSRREAIQSEKMDVFRRMRLEASNSAINGPF